MNKSIVLGIFLIGVGLYGSHQVSRTQAVADEPVVILPHPHFAGKFETCAAVDASGLDTEGANSLLAFGSSLNQSARTVHGLLDAFDPKPDEKGRAETVSFDQSTRYVPMSGFVCKAESLGRHVTFRRDWSGKVTGFDVQTDNGSMSAGLVENGKGLDGEKRYLVSSIDGIGDLNKVESGVAVTCLVSNTKEAQAVSSVVDSFGGILGVVLGSGSDQNASLSQMCGKIGDALD